MLWTFFFKHRARHTLSDLRLTALVYLCKQTRPPARGVAVPVKLL